MPRTTQNSCHISTSCMFSSPLPAVYRSSSYSLIRFSSGIFYKNPHTGHSQWENPYTVGDSELHGAVSYSYQDDESVKLLLDTTQAASNTASNTVSLDTPTRQANNPSSSGAKGTNGPLAVNAYGMIPLHLAAQNAYIQGIISISMFFICTHTMFFDPAN